MVIAGVVIETLPGQGSEVARRLARVEGLKLEGGDGDRKLAAVWSGAAGADLETLAERLLEENEAIVGLYPTFVAENPE